MAVRDTGGGNWRRDLDRAIDHTDVADAGPALDSLAPPVAGLPGEAQQSTGDDHRHSQFGNPYLYNPITDAVDAVDDYFARVQKIARKTRVAERDKELGIPKDRYRVITDPETGETRTVKVPGTQRSYDTTDDREAMAWLEKQKQKKRGIDGARKMLFFAGGYDNPEDVEFGDNGGYTEDDIAAVKKMMDDANSRGALLGETLPQMAKQGVTQGFPVGTNPDDAASGSSGGGGSTTAPDPLVEINKYADLNGLELTDDWVAREARRIGAGKRTVDDSLQALQRQVIARYPAWKEEIKDGLTVTDIASPYQQLAAQTLELPQESIGLNDPLVQRGLQGVGKNGEPAVKPLWQFQDELKKDPRWQYTDNAWSEVGGMAEEAMRMFGMTP